MLTGIAGIAAMGVDKLLAVMGWDRISERTLHIIALLGGFWGIIFGAFLFRHKTSQPEFWPPVLFAAALWVGLFLALVSGYLRLPGGSAARLGTFSSDPPDPEITAENYY